MLKIQDFLNSTPGQFIIGGTTVSGISYLSNFMNPLLGGIFGGIPIGLPSSVFIDDNKVLSYLENLSVMTIILSIVTISGYLLKKHTKKSKYEIIKITMSIWGITALIYYLLRLYKFF